MLGLIECLCFLIKSLKADNIPVYVPITSLKKLKSLQKGYISDDRVLVFDIDNTLYKSKGINNNIERFTSWLKKRTSPEGFKQYLKGRSNMGSFNLTLNVLNIDQQEFIDFTDEKIKNIPKYSKDNDLIFILSKIRHPKYAFTNARKEFAQKILRDLGIEKYFKAVFHPNIPSKRKPILFKPMKDSFKFVQKFLRIKNPKLITFYDDKEKNIKIAKMLGWNARLTIYPGVLDGIEIFVTD
ncbi:hypothetical protein A0H76_789 [Hepatospora eriocheir]|uniref:Uncharacterized protein n=1 Tax=Hepatospora eriocheir TaxID=1081669 RepID=A0A1X0QAK4_9MICR|nr:hypothetical protein A0H76_789 [Hepatospora eriocheir]ORD96820.1 hypothetical protein HERIO_1286 [Hepatospora eriocheir]